MFKIAFCLKKNLLSFLLLIFPILLFGQNNQSKDSLFLNNSLKEIYKKQNPSSFIGSYTYNPELNLYIYLNLHLYRPLHVYILLYLFVYLYIHLKLIIYKRVQI